MLVHILNLLIVCYVSTAEQPQSCSELMRFPFPLRPQLKPVEKDSEVVLKFPDVEKLSPPILQLDEVTYHYVPEKPVFKNVCVNANMESRVCIVSSFVASTSPDGDPSSWCIAAFFGMPLCFVAGR